MLPMGVADSMRDRLAYAIHTALADRDMRQELTAAGFEPGGLLTPSQITAHMAAEQDRWQPRPRSIGLLRR